MNVRNTCTYADNSYGDTFIFLICVIQSKCRTSSGKTYINQKSSLCNHHLQNAHVCTGWTCHPKNATASKCTKSSRNRLSSTLRCRHTMGIWNSAATPSVRTHCPTSAHCVRSTEMSTPVRSRMWQKTPCRTTTFRIGQPRWNESLPTRPKTGASSSCPTTVDRSHANSHTTRTATTTPNGTTDFVPKSVSSNPCTHRLCRGQSITPTVPRSTSCTHVGTRTF